MGLNVYYTNRPAQELELIHTTHLVPSHPLPTKTSLQSLLYVLNQMHRH